MKPASIINRGDTFVTLRVSTDRPAEIREALAARDVQHVYKGDQNQAWDAVLANHCLARAVGPASDGVDLTFFVHDERLGTADARLVRHWRSESRRFVLTEDYYRSRSGAVWEHQDISHGVLFSEAVSPEQFAGAGIHIHRLADAWDRQAADCSSDLEWLEALKHLGVCIPGVSPGRCDASGLGPAVQWTGLSELAAEHPSAGLYYALTKTDGLYGLVPVENENRTMAGIPVGDPEIAACLQRLLVLAVRGAVRFSSDPSQRRGILGRGRRVAAWGADFLKANPRATVADLQVAFGVWLTHEIFPADTIEIDRSSRFTRMSASEFDGGELEDHSLHYFLDLALRYPSEFTDSYNDALNRVGFGLQRMKFDPADGVYTLPFFVEFAEADDDGVYRYELELSDPHRSTVLLKNPSRGDRILEAGHPIDSAEALFLVLSTGLNTPRGFSVVGKAAAFSAELQRAPRGLGLPRQGSKYTPMVDHLVSGLRSRGILRQPTGLLIRIGLNALDRFAALGSIPIRMPEFLRARMGDTVACARFAREWRSVAAQAQQALECLSHLLPGQEVHLARLLVEGDSSHRRVGKLLRQMGLTAVPDGLKRLAEELGPTVRGVTLRLLDEREQLLQHRMTHAQTGPWHLRDRTVDLEINRLRESVDTRLKILMAAWVRRLWQRAESLSYVNDRPYTLSLYLAFGLAIFPPICRNVEFDVEWISPCPTPEHDHSECT